MLADGVLLKPAEPTACALFGSKGLLKFTPPIRMPQSPLYSPPNSTLAQPRDGFCYIVQCQRTSSLRSELRVLVPAAAVCPIVSAGDASAAVPDQPDESCTVNVHLVWRSSVSSAKINTKSLAWDVMSVVEQEFVR